MTIGLPLDGIRVVELATFISAPFATMMLADLGADVIKVEPPRGDPFRRFGWRNGAIGPLFANTNRGKRSVVLDLKEPAGLEGLQRLMGHADILVCNWRPGAIARLGLDDRGLVASNPGLIRLYVSGFGAEGPLADAPGYDSVFQARLGMVDTSAVDPALAPSYVVDKTAAAMTCQAALAALLARERTGVAERVDIAMVDAAAYLNYPDTMVNRTFLDHEPPEARNRQAAAARPVRCRDGWIVVAPVTGEQIRRSFEAIRRPEVADELLAIGDAVELTERMFDEFQRVTATQSVAQCLAAFGAADVPASPCLSLDEHLADPQIQRNGTYGVMTWGPLGRVRYVRYPATFGSSGRIEPRGGPPARGEHTNDILAGLAPAEPTEGVA